MSEFDSNPFADPAFRHPFQVTPLAALAASVSMGPQPRPGAPGGSGGLRGALGRLSRQAVSCAVVTVCHFHMKPCCAASILVPRLTRMEAPGG